MARTVGFFHSGSQGTFQRDFQFFADDMIKTARQKDLNVMPRFASDERSKSTMNWLRKSRSFWWWRGARAPRRTPRRR